MWDPYAELQKAVLRNGLTSYHTYWDRPWLQVQFVVHSGARDDRPDREGTAHFVEHLISENTADGHSSREIKLEFEKRGGYVSLGTTGYSRMEYSFWVPCSHIQFALHTLGQMLVGCSMTRALEQERSAIVGEFAQKFPLPIAFEEVLRRRNALWGYHQLGRFVTPLGNLPMIAAIDRSDLQTFYDRHFVPKNISMISIGGISHEELLRFLGDSSLGESHDGERNPLPEVLKAVTPPRETLFPISSTEMFGQRTMQSRYASAAALPSGFVGSAIHRAREALYEKLFMVLRVELGQTYGFRVRVEPFPEATEVMITGALDWSSIDKIDAIVDRCIGEVARDTDSISHFIKVAIARGGMRDVSAGKILDNVALELGLEHEFSTATEDLAEDKAVTVEQVQEVLGYLMPGRRFTVILTP